VSKPALKREPVIAPENRGALLTDTEVAKLLKLNNPEKMSVRRWVRANVPGVRRLSYTTLRWFEQDVLDWVASRGSR
jgi:hypothetical protein